MEGLTIHLDSALAIACFFIAITFFAGIAKNMARKGIRGFVSLYEAKNMIFFSLAFVFLMIGVYMFYPNKTVLLLAPFPMILFFIFSRIKKQVSKRKGKKSSSKERQTQEAILISKELGYE